jgi:hypothetical protein
VQLNSEIDRLLTLQAQLPPAPAAAQTRADLLMLRAETALCGPVQDPAACIQLCDEVVLHTQDGELRSRAFGHRGLAHLAAYQPDDAEHWLHLAISAAHAAAHPYAEYEAVHWLSKKKLACLELADAAALLERLAQTSEASGVARDSPFHRRDASRLLALQGDTDRSATTFLQYGDLAAATERGRVLTTLACQVHEAEQVHGAAVAGQLLTALSRAATAREPDPAQGGSVAVAAQRLHRRPRGWHPRAFAVDVLDADPAEADAAEAIFRFDVPDLAHLRRQSGRS